MLFVRILWRARFRITSSNLMALGGWRIDFKVPRAILRWLGTMVLAASFLHRLQTAHTVTLATGMHIGFCWLFYIRAAITQSQSRFSNFDEIKRFILCLPEYKIWRSTTMAFLVALVTTFFPKDITAKLGLVLYAWYFWGCYGTGN
ncbi:hypothetical protein TIFTF001_002415 [Ficus carica]|uniref:Uncharacterized protein n=1 Tax=Ficus carica TaxID=3494 RepID=A0AA88CS65_FICCA|nr:hypothetical protein TIFTF001_002415 [Ficus carica]